jgi:hypothetical protein
MDKMTPEQQARVVAVQAEERKKLATHTKHATSVAASIQAAINRKHEKSQGDRLAPAVAPPAPVVSPEPSMLSRMLAEEAQVWVSPTKKNKPNNSRYKAPPAVAATHQHQGTSSGPPPTAQPIARQQVQPQAPQPGPGTSTAPPAKANTGTKYNPRVTPVPLMPPPTTPIPLDLNNDLIKILGDLGTTITANTRSGEQMSSLITELKSNIAAMTREMANLTGRLSSIENAVGKLSSAQPKAAVPSRAVCTTSQQAQLPGGYKKH